MDGAHLAFLGFGTATPTAARCTARTACGPCHRCKHGRCRRRKDGRACPGGTCRKGECLPGLGGGCLPPGESCIANEQCCGAICALVNCNPSPDAGPACCVPPGGECEDFCECCKGLTCEVPPGGVQGSCTCPSGQTTCSGACVNTQTDVNNCGGCGRTCPRGQACCRGACVNPLEPICG